MRNPDHALDRPLLATTVLATITVGLSAGFFSTYQWSVTRGLARVDDATYVQAFQQINDTVRTPWFAVVFFGAGIFGALATAAAVRARRTQVARLAGLATVLYVAGVLAITFAGNVPLNEDLGLVIDPAGFSAARAVFEDDWNQLNLWRALCGTASFLAALGAFAVSLRPPARL